MEGQERLCQQETDTEYMYKQKLKNDEVVDGFN
jgi:hypothetical protein